MTTHENSKKNVKAPNLMDQFKPVVPAAGQVVLGQPKPIDISLIDDNPFQYRKFIDKEKLQELAEGIKKKGLLQPITLRPVDGRFQIVAGHRRRMCFQILLDAATNEEEKKRWSHIDALIRDVPDSEMAVMAITENVDREDTSPLDLAAAVFNLGKAENLDSKGIADRLVIDRSKVIRLLHLHNAPEVIKAAMQPGRMVDVPTDEGTKRERRSLDLSGADAFRRLWDALKKKPKANEKRDSERLAALVDKALTEGWGARRIIDEVNDAIAGRPSKKPVEAKPALTWTKTDKNFALALKRSEIEAAGAEDRQRLVLDLKELISWLEAPQAIQAQEGGSKGSVATL